eukprot:CAMPEP_0184239538 /NCGR_PEP_ID=MMETSP0976-20121227/27435_1 /TAXON_ID=483370 /ORGANISM="non described non described, Strain CCMP2097" /LENGTH=64 /DNA_ID=CAMNT_0026544753 /DNA_START=33 /DNA_END=223 /DNA_ORIENTATION=-
MSAKAPSRGVAVTAVQRRRIKDWIGNRRRNARPERFDEGRRVAARGTILEPKRDLSVSCCSRQP